MTMPFGKYEGWELAELPDDYLSWLYTLDDLRYPLKGAVAAEVRRRSAEESVLAIEWAELPILEEMLEAGFKVLLRKHHPDAGGDTAQMQNLNVLMASVRRQIRWAKGITD